jgi:hypothetical protein
LPEKEKKKCMNSSSATFIGCPDPKNDNRRVT